MSKNTLLSELINYVSANSSGNVTVAAPTSGVALTVNGTGRFTGQLSLGSTITNGTFTYTLPGATGTLALTSQIPSVTGFVPYSGATENVDLGVYSITPAMVYISGVGTGGGGVLNLKKDSTRTVGGSDAANTISVWADGTSLGFNDWTSGNTRSVKLSVASITNNTTVTLTIPNASGTLALTSNLSSYVPYTGATGAVNLGAFDLTVNSIRVGRGSGNIFDNTTVGTFALTSNTTGTANTAVGYFSLNVNTTGGANSSFGVFSLMANTTGTSNTGIGGSTLLSNTTGNQNTALGFNTLQNNTTGGANTGTGIQSLKANTTGLFNTASGANALGDNTTGNYNTAIGNNAGLYLTTGSNNTIVGGYVGVAAMASNVVLSDGAGNIRFQFDGTNTLLGQSGGVYINTSANSGFKLDVNGTGRFSSNFYVSGGTNVNTGNGIHMYYESSYAQIQLNSATGSLIDFSTSGTDYLARILYTNATNLLEFKNNVGTTNFALANSGAATFTSSVTASGLISGSASIYQTNASGSIASNVFESYNGGATELRFNFPVSGSVGFNNGSTRLAITSTGNVGIGTTSPESITTYRTLQITGGGVSTGGIFTTVTSDGSLKGRFLTSGGEISIGAVTNSPFVIFTNDTERMRILAGGSVAIGDAGDSNVRFQIKALSTSNTQYATIMRNSAGNELFYVRNDGAFYTGNAANSPYNLTTGSSANVFVESGSGLLYRSTSSIKYKKNVLDYSKGLSEIMQMRAVTYEGKSKADEGKIFAGLIAEEVHDLGLTEFVQYAEDGTPDALAYQNMVSLLVKGIQELKAELDTLKNK